MPINHESSVDRRGIVVTDAYTKAVLTVIAGALVYIGAMLSGQPASAQTMAAAPQTFFQASKPQAVVVVGWGSVRSDGQVLLHTVRDPAGGTRTDSTLPVAVQATREKPVPVSIQPGPQPLPVSLGVTAQQPLPVGLTAIKAGADWDAINAKVDQPLTRLPGKP